MQSGSDFTQGIAILARLMAVDEQTFMRIADAEDENFFHRLRSRQDRQKGNGISVGKDYEPSTTLG